MFRYLGQIMSLGQTIGSSSSSASSQVQRTHITCFKFLFGCFKFQLGCICLCNMAIFTSAEYKNTSVTTVKYHMIKCTFCANFVLQVMSHKGQTTRLPLLYSKRTEFLVSNRTLLKAKRSGSSSSANGRVGPTARTYMHTRTKCNC